MTKLELNNSVNLPHFKTYLATRAKLINPPPGLYGILPGLGMAIPVTVFTDFTFMQSAIVMGVATLGIWNLAHYLINRNKPRLTEPVLEGIKAYNAVESNKLHKHVDRTACQLLEAGAFYWVKIHTLLEADSWQSSIHMQGLRTDIGAAANQAMDDLMVLASRCIGSPGNSRGNDFKKAFDDLMELDVKEALGGFVEALNANGEKYKFQSPHISGIFPAARDIAERLKLLAEEVVTTTQENERARLEPNVSSNSTLAGIDAVLNSLKATRVAQDELSEISDIHDRL